MTFCSACGMRSDPDAVHLCTLEVLVALRHQPEPHAGGGAPGTPAPAPA